MRSATAFAPGTVGNVGPGFDVLGLAVAGIGDRVTVTLIDAGVDRVSVRGRDHALIPADPARNAAAIAARSALSRFGYHDAIDVAIDKGLPASGGLGGSAASSVAGALAATLAIGRAVDPLIVIEDALRGEEAVAGRHLDNIVPCVLGGLTLVRAVDPLDVCRLRVRKEWHVALVTPAIRVETRTARALLPNSWDRTWIRQMANTAALVHAFAEGDEELLKRSLDDLFAEPRRKPLVARFDEVKSAALHNGALGCSLSGSGPTLFAIAASEHEAESAARAMVAAFLPVESTRHVGAIAREGAVQV